MLTFAAMTTPAEAWGGAVSRSSINGASDDLSSAPPISPAPARASQACPAPSAHYWPCELLNAFILKMAATGHCVSAAMMLGHRGYALEQLGVALGVQDDSLNALARQLQTYFDAAAPQGCAAMDGMEGA